MPRPPDPERRATAATALLSRRLSRPWRIAILCALYAALIAGSLLPQTAPSPENGFDIDVHMTVYAGVTVVTAFLTGWPMVSALFVFALSVGLEAAQGLVPARTPSLSDIVANGIGVCAGLGMFAALAVILAMWVRWRHLPGGRGSAGRAKDEV